MSQSSRESAGEWGEDERNRIEGDTVLSSGSTPKADPFLGTPLGIRPFFGVP